MDDGRGCPAASVEDRIRSGEFDLLRQQVMRPMSSVTNLGCPLTHHANPRRSSGHAQLRSQRAITSSSMRTAADEDEDEERHRHASEARFRPCLVPDDSWGFPRGVPHMDELLNHAAELLREDAHYSRRRRLPRESSDSAGHHPQMGGGDLKTSVLAAESEARPAAAPAPALGPLLHTAFLDALLSSRAFRSPHCEGEMAKAFGVQV